MARRLKWVERAERQIGQVIRNLGELDGTLAGIDAPHADTPATTIQTLSNLLDELERGGGPGSDPGDLRTVAE